MVVCNHGCKLPHLLWLYRRFLTYLEAMKVNLTLRVLNCFGQIDANTCWTEDWGLILLDGACPRCGIGDSGFRQPVGDGFGNRTRWRELTEDEPLLGCGRSEILADALRCCSCTTSPEAPTTTVETLP